MKKHRQSAFWQELHRDWRTIKSLCWRQRLLFLWDYYKWRILAAACILITIPTILSILWEGQQPCRLHVRILPDTVMDCGGWVSAFTEELQSDGKPGMVDIHYDQAFTRYNPYHQVQEMEILATISSKRLDAAVCSEDLFHYLLELNACLPLEQGLSGELVQSLLDRGLLVYAETGTGGAADGTGQTAADTSERAMADGTGLTAADGTGHVPGQPTAGKRADGSGTDRTGGYYAVDLSESAFYEQYGPTMPEGHARPPLYLVILLNTEHLEDCEALVRALCGS